MVSTSESPSRDFRSMQNTTEMNGSYLWQRRMGLPSSLSTAAHASLFLTAAMRLIVGIEPTAKEVAENGPRVTSTMMDRKS